MNSTLRSPIYDLNRTLLLALTEAFYNQDTEMLREFGIAEATARHLAALNPAHLHRIAKTPRPLCTLRLNEHLINICITTISLSDERDRVIDEAIQLGASKDIMRDLCAMSCAEFKKRRLRLGINTRRARPLALSTVEHTLLVEGHHKLTQRVEGEPLERLALLINLARHTSIEINRIHTYYLQEQFSLGFLPSKRPPREGAISDATL